MDYVQITGWQNEVTGKIHGTKGPPHSTMGLCGNGGWLLDGLRNKDVGDFYDTPQTQRCEKCNEAAKKLNPFRITRKLVEAFKEDVAKEGATVRVNVAFRDVKNLQKFYRTEKSVVVYRKLPDNQTMSSDHGHSYPATIYQWVREDWKGKVNTLHSWSGSPENVWVDRRGDIDD